MFTSSLINVILLGCAFMILFTAFQTTTIISPSVLEGMKNESNFQVNGYVGLSVLNVFFTISNILAPMAVSWIGPTWSMFIAAICYCLYVASFISPTTWSFYLAAVIDGASGGVLWTAQGTYLSQNCQESTASRNSGIFWALFQASLFAGNVYLYVALKTQAVDKKMRYTVFAVLSTVATLSLVFFFVLIVRSWRARRNHENIKENQRLNLSKTLQNAFRLFKRRSVQLLLIPFLYTGYLIIIHRFSPTFFIVVYATCIGHYVKYSDDRKRFIGLHGLFVAFGEVLGGGLFGFFTKPRTASQRSLIVFCGFLIHSTFYYLAFINFPSNAPTTETTTRPYINFDATTSKIIAFFGSFLSGLGDSAYNTQIITVLASRFHEDSASIFSIFRCIQGLGAALAFSYASTLSVSWQLLILVILSFLASLALFYVLFDKSTNQISSFVTIQDEDRSVPSYQTTTYSN